MSRGTRQNEAVSALRRGQKRGWRVEHVPGAIYTVTAQSVGVETARDSYRITIPAPLARAFGLAPGVPLTVRLDGERHVIEIALVDEL